MGTLIGHVAPGFGFFIIGFWHMYNQMKHFTINPKKYISFPWFPLNYNHHFLRHFELYLIIFSTSLSISMELIIGPQRHTPFNPDGTIPSNHLHNLEHASISLLFLIYAVFALLLEHLRIRHRRDMVHLIAGFSFAQQLLIFHLHSADHMGVEGQYHWLLQLIIAVSLTTTVVGIPLFRSFVVSYLRSISIMFQGLWLIFMGFMLWTPSLMMKGCFMHVEDGHKVVRCGDDESVHRAKGLVNIMFSWVLIGVVVFAVGFYVVMMWVYDEGESTHDDDEMMYREVGQVDDDDDDVEKNEGMIRKKKSGDDEINTQQQQQQSYRNYEMGWVTPAIDHMER